MRAYFYNLWLDETGVTTVEYALLLALVAIVSISAWTALGTAVRDALTRISAGFGTPVK